LNDIKKLQINDLLKLNQFILSEKENFDNFIDLGWSYKNIKSHFMKEGNLSYGYFKNNILNGFLIGEKIINETNFDFEIHIIFVSKNYRRMNIGSKLLDFIHKNKNLINISNIYLEVSENNEVAIKFYEKNNFVFFKIRHNYYKYKNKKINAKCYIKKL
tara:strand:+ start:322 stop:798 length:477 start_codon:yes stop_codon:yes gene_type:complete